jgi:DNA invertase Pin-like site-specific DNA recombinase
MSIFSEHECEMLSARTKAALEAAKAGGNVLDNPNIKVISQKRRAKVSTKADQFAEALRPIIVALQKRSIDTLSAIAEELNIRRIKTYRNDGSKWHVSTVKSLMKRLG